MFKVGLGGRKSPRFLLAAFDALLVVVVVVLVGLVKGWACVVVLPSFLGCAIDVLDFGGIGCATVGGSSGFRSVGGALRWLVGQLDVFP